MDKILVSGLVNIETTLQIDSFPLEYNPTNYSFFGIDSAVSGVGYNVAKALNTLGAEVDLLSLVGDDLAGQTVEYTLQKEGLSTEYILEYLTETPQSVIIYDQEGKRQNHTDLKDIQQKDYPVKFFSEIVKEASLVCLCNINFSRPFLNQAQELGKTIATDVHTISELDDDYNRDFMAAADILFMSDEELPCSPEEWASRVQTKYDTDIIVIGLGERGALLAVKEDDFLRRFPAVRTREVVNTVGAGDSLFSAFVYFYNKTQNPYLSIRKAVVFASYKVGATSASKGFLSEAELNQLYKEVKTAQV